MGSYYIRYIDEEGHFSKLPFQNKDSAIGWCLQNNIKTWELYEVGRVEVDTEITNSSKY